MSSEKNRNEKNNIHGLTYDTAISWSHNGKVSAICRDARTGFSNIALALKRVTIPIILGAYFVKNHALSFFGFKKERDVEISERLDIRFTIGEWE